MATLSRSQLTKIAKAVGPDFTLDELKLELAHLGHTIEGVNAPMATHVPTDLPPIDPATMLSPQAKLMKMGLDALPFGGGLGGSVAGGTVGAAPGSVLGAGLGGGLGKVAQRAGYSHMGLPPPGPDAIIKLLEKRVPGLSGVHPVLQESGSAMAQQMLGLGIEKIAGPPLRYVSKKASELITGGATDLYDPAATAAREGIAFSKRGILKSKRVISQISEARDAAIRSNTSQFDVMQDVLGPVLTKMRARDVRGAQIPEDAADYISYIATRWARSAANKGSVSARRLYEMTKPTASATRHYVAKEGGRTLDPGKLSYYEGLFYRNIADQARAVLYDAMPDVAMSQARISALKNLRTIVYKKIRDPGLRGLSHRAAPVIGGAVGSVMPAQSHEERLRNMILGGGAGLVVSNPDIMLALVRAAREIPRATTAAADALDYE